MPSNGQNIFVNITNINISYNVANEAFSLNANKATNIVIQLIDTVLSGWVYQNYGLEACLWISSIFVAMASLLSLKLPKNQSSAIAN
jgi:predicted MFS family arabinose efflux permease